MDVAFAGPGTFTDGQLIAWPSVAARVAASGGKLVRGLIILRRRMGWYGGLQRGVDRLAE